MTNNKRIIYIIGSLNIGGAEKHLSLVVPALIERGYNVSIISLSSAQEGDYTSLLLQKGVSIQNLPPKLLFTQLPYFIQSPIKLVARFLWLTKQLCNERESTLQFFLPEAYCLGMLSSLLVFHKGPRILSRRSLNNYQQKRKLLARVERKLHRYINYATGNSKKILKQLEEEGIPANKQVLIYNGIDCKQFDSNSHVTLSREALDIPADALVLIMVANLIPYKGHADLLYALGQIKDKMPFGWRLLCLGRDDGILSQLKALAESEEIANHVVWLGTQTNVKDYLRISDMGLLCSHQEGFSNTILEYMAAKLPLIVTDVGGNTEAVIDQTTGYIVPAKNPEKLAEAILDLVFNKDKRRLLGLAGHNRVKEKFSLNSTLQSYEDFYLKIFSSIRT